MNNEKIKEMAEKCVSDNQFAVGDFTKLLIDECMIALSSVEKPHIYTSFDVAQHDASIAHAKKAINKHFGIDE
jgi:hypothetical protein